MAMTQTQTKPGRISRLRKISVAGIATAGAAAAALTLVPSPPTPRSPPSASTAVTQAAEADKKSYANNLDGWIRQSLDIMKSKGIPGSYEGLHRNIMRESAGNPNAQNGWDVNAQNGTPSKGLLQVIQPTFDAYHVAGTAKQADRPGRQHHRGRQLRRRQVRLDRQRRLRLLSDRPTTHVTRTTRSPDHRSRGGSAHAARERERAPGAFGRRPRGARLRARAGTALTAQAAEEGPAVRRMGRPGRWCSSAEEASPTPGSTSTATSRARTSNAALGQDRPAEQQDGSMNILLLGSDSRAGTHGEYGRGVSGARADTAMVLHVDKTHKKASVVSIPRDTMVAAAPVRAVRTAATRGRRAAGHVQLVVPGGRARLHREDGREDVGRPHGPLPRSRLQGVPEAHRRARRRGHHHPQGHQGPQQRSLARPRASTRSRASRRWSSSAPGTAWGTAVTSAASSCSRRSSRP